ncbi:neprilysin-1-like isoform X2 [Dermacentor albipictus]|uniref:neprilysin-1-like isoform X2 n=1 Tax=Dermacentor albipictus TaxID=60249 RepID=UPI0031FDFE7B
MDDISKKTDERVPRGTAQAEPRPSQSTVDDPAVRSSDGTSSKQAKHGESLNEDTTRRTSAVERALRWRTGMCLLLALVVAASALLFVYLLFFKDPRRRVDYCFTEDCVAHAAELLGTLNAEADPCQDFYEFACGKATDAGRSGRDPLVHRMYLRTLDAGARSLEENQAATAAAGSTLTAELLYQSCVGPKRSDAERSLAEFREFRAARGMRWPESPQPADGVDPLDLMLDLAINWNLNFLFDVRVLALPTAEPALVLSRGKLGYVWQDDVRRRSVQGGAQEYEGYVHEYYRVLSVAPQSNVTAATLRELEEAILAAKLDVAADESEQTWFQFSSLGNNTPSVEPGAWLTLVNKQFAGQFVWSDEHWVVVDGPAVLSHVDKLLQAYGNQLLVVGLAWVFVQSHLWAVANRAELVFRDDTVGHRRHACFEYAESRFGLLSVAELLAKTFGPEDARRNVADFESVLKLAAAAKLGESTWIEASAKKVALRKVDRLSLVLLPPADFFDKDWRQRLGDRYGAAGTGFVSNLLNASRSYRDLRSERSLFDSVCSRRMFPSDRHASYVYVANRADVSLGSVAAPLYYLKGTFAMNYGALGTVLAAQYARSFDLRGSGLDESGRRTRWWKQADYRSRAECELAAHNGNESALDAVRVFPALVALEIAFAAFKQAVHEDSQRLYDFKLPHLDAYTDKHIFFITYCHTLCGAPSARERCNVPLRHFLPFLKAFRCSRDSAMSAAEKCSFLDA